MKDEIEGQEEWCNHMSKDEKMVSMKDRVEKINEMVAKYRQIRVGFESAG